MLPKPAGGARPISLFPVAIRVWMRAVAVAPQTFEMCDRAWKAHLAHKSSEDAKRQKLADKALADEAAAAASAQQEAA